jgi:tetratricopeptide (TPR) repeat protein
MDPGEYFRRGLRAFREGRAARAREDFERAMSAERRLGAVRPSMRFLSYHGLSRALAEGMSREALEACERAAQWDDFDPDLMANLGWIYLLANRRTSALAALEKGLRLEPENRRLKALLRRAERRSRPVLPRLSRSHFLNRTLGRLRRRLLARKSVSAPSRGGLGGRAVAWETGGRGGAR